MKEEYKEGLSWEGMENPETYTKVSQEKAEEDLEGWLMTEAKRIGGGQLPAKNLDISYDPDYTYLQVRKVGGRNELHIGTFGLRPAHFYQKGFREGISHELAHLLRGETETIPYSDEFIRRELRADLTGIGSIKAGALVNLVKGISSKFKLRLPDGWDDVSEIARKEFNVSPQVLASAKKQLELT